VIFRDNNTAMIVDQPPAQKNMTGSDGNSFVTKQELVMKVLPSNHPVFGLKENICLMQQI